MDPSDLDLLLQQRPDLRALNPELVARDRRASKSKSEPGTAEHLIDQVADYGLPLPAKEIKFHPVRKWRLDLGWVLDDGRKIACEIEGGIWMQTETGRSKGHAHPKRFEQDIEKYNAAVLMGWELIRVTPEMIKDGSAVEIVIKLLTVQRG